MKSAPEMCSAKSYEEMLYWLRAHGIDVDAFNADPRAGKRLSDLYMDLQSEARMGYANGQVFVMSRTVRITVTADGERYLLRETKRLYKHNNRKVVHQHYWSLSETIKILEGETADQATVRCLREECGLDIELSQVRMPPIHKAPPVISDEKHESSVYPGIWRYAIVDWRYVYFERRPWKRKLRVIRDDNVRIWLRWDDQRALRADHAVST